MFGRRELLAFGAAALATRGALARGRSPVGGRVQLRVPWPTSSLDPHLLDDVTCAIFGGDVFDSLYAYENGRVDGSAGGGTSQTPKVVPALAETLPEAHAGGARVRMRSGLTSATGRPIGLREVLASLARARASDARAWLVDVVAPKRVDALTLHFPGIEPSKLAGFLASPLCAILPGGFSPSRPDATGAFAAAYEGGGLALARNERAASGPAFLDAIAVKPAADLADSLRSFEAGADDVGWLGTGLHEPRAGARTFDAGPVAWVLLRTGRDAGTWDAPGVAQRLADGISPSLLAHLAPGPAWNFQPDQGWGGPPCDLLVREDSPYLLDVARSVAGALTRASHEVTVRPIAAAILRQRRAARTYALAIDAVRPFAPGLLGTLAALATSDSPELARDAVRYPPRRGDMPPRTIARTMRVGVVCEVRVQGGRIPTLALPPRSTGGVDWSDATRAGRP